MLRDPGLIPLSHDHHHALKLCVLARRALTPGAGPDQIATQAREIVEKFDSDIHGHFVFEESTLFPALAPFPGVRNLIAELLKEHRSMESLIEQIRTTKSRAPIEEFCEVLEQHVRKEEQSLFEEAQRLLSREQLDKIGIQRSH